MSWYFVKVYGSFLLLIASRLPDRIVAQDQSHAPAMFKSSPNVTCNFETTCSWTWSADSFTNDSATNLWDKIHSSLNEIPKVDGSNRNDGMWIIIAYIL